MDFTAVSCYWNVVEHLRMYKKKNVLNLKLR